MTGGQNWSVAQEAVGAAASCRLQARPRPVSTSLDHPGPQWSAFNLTQRSEIVIVEVDRKGLKTHLQDMPAAMRYCQLLCSENLRSGGVFLDNSVDDGVLLNDVSDEFVASESSPFP